MMGFDIDVTGTLQRAKDTLQGNSLVKFAKGFSDQPGAALGSIAERYGFGNAGKALKTGRIDDIVSAVGKDTIGLLAHEGARQINKAIDGVAGKYIEIFKALDRSDPPPVGEVLLILGDFAFMVGTVAHQSIKRSNEYRWAQQDRLLRTPAQQFVGPGAERIELEGYLLPHFTGGADSISFLREQASLGIPLELIDHFGSPFGRFVVTSLEETGTELGIYGQPRRIEFRLSLAAYGEDELGAYGGTGKFTPADGIEPDETGGTAV